MDLRLIRASTLIEQQDVSTLVPPRPASSPVAGFYEEHIERLENVLVVPDTEDEELDESDDDDDEEDEEEEEEDGGIPDLEDKLLLPESNPSKQPTSASTSQPSASSTQSASSSRSLALPPLTSHQLTRSRYIIGAPTFFDSFFGGEELDRYFPDRKLRLSIITWNMSSKPPDNYNQVLQDLLIPRVEGKEEEIAEQQLPELFVIGLQETPKSEVIVANLKVGIQAVLGPNYALLQWSAMGVLHASIWLRRELLWSCTSVDTVTIHYRPTAANRIKTKGALALSFSLFGTSFLFINTHLSAHEANLRTRINQLDKVHQALNLKRTRRKSSKLTPENGHIAGMNEHSKAAKNIPSATSRSSSKRQSRSNKHSEYLFWLGDLNFRLELPIESVLDAIKNIARANTDEARLGIQKKLMRSDQLTNLMARDMVFEGFREAIWPPPFLPTYKWKIKSKYQNHSSSNKNLSNSESYSSSSPTPSLGSAASLNATNSSPNSRSVPVNLNDLVASSNNLDESYARQYSEETMGDYNITRTPSFTDRILYQSRLANGDIDLSEQVINCIRYLSLASIMSSDHKPVYGLFEVSLDSGGPRIPFRLKKLGQMVDGIKSKILSKDNSLEESVQYNNGTAQHGLGRNISFFSRKLGRSQSRAKSKANGMHAAGGSQGLQSVSLSSLQSSSNSASSLGRLDRLARLNAGAFERQVFIDGLRMRNSLLQNVTLDEFNEKHGFALFKSHSLDSNVPGQSSSRKSIATAATGLVPLNKTDSDRRATQSQQTEHQSDRQNGIGHRGALPEKKPPSNSSICALM